MTALRKRQPHYTPKKAKSKARPVARCNPKRKPISKCTAKKIKAAPKTSKIKIGIMSLEDYKQRTIAIAKGELIPKPDEPKIWFQSIKSLASVLSESNQALLKTIIKQQPDSVAELEPLTGRKANNILRTLRTLENYGFVEFEEGVQGRGRPALKPIVKYDLANIELDFRVKH